MDEPLPDMPEAPAVEPVEKALPPAVMYQFVGIVGGENAYTCSRCGAVVREPEHALHGSWHATVG